MSSGRSYVTWSNDQSDVATTLEVVVITKRGAARVTGQTTSVGLLEHTLDVADTIEGPWVAVVAGAHRYRDAFEQAIPVPWPGRGLWAWLRLAMRAHSRKNAWPTVLVRRLGGVRLQPASPYRDAVAVVFSDRNLVSAFDGAGLTQIQRIDCRPWVGILFRPGADLDVPPAWWSSDEVGRCEALLRESAACPEDGLGARALLAIAEESHGGWVILPAQVLREHGSRSLQELGVTLGERLADDLLFQVFRLPSDYKLVQALDGTGRVVVVRSGSDHILATIEYVRTPEEDRHAYMTLHEVPR